MVHELNVAMARKGVMLRGSAPWRSEPASAPEPAPGRRRIYDSITQTIGNTPLVQLNRLPRMHKEHAMRPAHLMFAIAYATVAMVVIFAHSGPVPGAGAQRTAGGERSAAAAVTMVRRFDK